MNRRSIVLVLFLGILSARAPAYPAPPSPSQDLSAYYGNRPPPAILIVGEQPQVAAVGRRIMLSCSLVVGTCTGKSGRRGLSCGYRLPGALWQTCRRSPTDFQQPIIGVELVRKQTHDEKF